MADADVETAPLLTAARPTTVSIESGAFSATAPVGLGKDKAKADAEKTPTWRILLGCAYMCAMGVCGIVLTAIGSTLDQLAVKCGTTALKVSTVFLARGAGAVLGSFGSGKFYSWFHGNYVLVVALVWVGAVLIMLAFCTHIWYLHVLFGLLGFGTAVTDTGCQIMSRKAHGRNAGPWLGANTLLFGVAGALVPLMELATTNLLTQFLVLSSISVATAVAIVVIPVPTYLGQSMDKKLGKNARAAASGGASGYWVEVNLSCCVFCLIGGKVTFSSYLKDYLAQTGAISAKSLALTMLWVAITAGRFLGLRDQITVESKGALYNHLYCWLVLGAVGMMCLLSAPKSTALAWVGILLYGFGNGPCVGYCYDINNRITIPSEFGMSIVMFGLNFGASIVPYVTALAWEASGDAFYLTLVTFVTMVLPIGFLRMTKVFQKEEIGFMYSIGPGKIDATT